MSIDVKICGIKTESALRASIEHGAKYTGFVFYPASPRAVDIESAQKLAEMVPPSVTAVGLFVDPKDSDLLAVLAHVPLGMIQLHGKEAPKRVTSIKAVTGLPVMKAIGIATAEDLEQLEAYETTADMLLFDAKPSRQARLPGGNAESFDWTLLRARTFKKPWLLAGGINAGNIEEAVKASGATGIDVSSGVEDQPGHKSPDKIRQLLELAKQL